MYSLGRLSTQTNTYLDGCDTSPYPFTKFDYDASSRLWKKTYPDGTWKTTTYSREANRSIGTKKYRDFRHEKYRTDLKKYTEILFACHLLFMKGDLVAQISGVTYSHASSYPLSTNTYNWRNPKGFFLAIYASAGAWLDNPAYARALFIALFALALLAAIALWLYIAFFRLAHTLVIPRPLAHVIPGLLVMFFITFCLPGCFDVLFDNGPAGNVYYFRPNHIGSVRMITDRLGNVVV